VKLAGITCATNLPAHKSKEMFDFLKENSEYGAVAPQLLYPSGEIQLSCRPFYGWKTYLMELVTFGSYKDKFYNHTKSQKVDQPMASVLMVRGELLKELRGFDDDEDFFLYFNDVDLSFRIHQKGFDHYFLSEAKFFHHHGKSAYGLKDVKRTWLWHQGLHRFFTKNIIKRKFSLKYLFLLILMFFSYIILNISLIFKVYKHKNSNRKNN
jgi:GT2 family glycosyltransferase